MPVVVELVPGDRVGSQFAEDTEKIFAYFRSVDEKFSPYKEESEVSQFGRGEIALAEISDDVREVLTLAEETQKLTDGYFNVYRPDGFFDPSGLVKGWAIQKAAQLARSLGYEDFYIEAGGDIQTSGRDSEGKKWSIGIRNPFNREEIVKVVYPLSKGIATSGTYERGAHIYNPHTGHEPTGDLASITVIGSNVYEADRFATAAFAMGERGIEFIEQYSGLEGYAIHANKTATMTSGFETYTNL